MKKENMEKSSKIYVAGHTGLVGSAIMRRLKSGGYTNIVFRTHAELDLTRQEEVEKFFEKERPEYVFLAAAKVGGIGANSHYPAEFIYENLAIALNIINTSYKYQVKKLVNLGSSCIYPKLAPQPLKEDYLLTGALEPTNEAYAIAKIAAIKLCKHYNEQYGTNYISVMPTNLYGVGDNYDLENSHVLPAMIRKFHEAKEKRADVTLWGDGSPYREFLNSEDCADAIVFLMERFSYSQIGEFVNLGTGKEITIKGLAEIISEIIGFTGNIHWDSDKPNGAPRKLLDTSRLMEFGWKSKIAIKEGVISAYEDYIKRY